MTTALTAAGVQQVTVTIAAGSLTGTASISPVGSGATFRWQGFNATDTATQFDDTNSYVTFSGTTLTVTRGATGVSQTVTVKVTVTDGDTTNLIKSVQMGTVAITSTSTTATATLSAVTNANTVVGYLGETASSSISALSAAETALSLSGITLTASRLSGTATTLTTAYCATEYQATALNSSTQNINFSTAGSGTSGTVTITGVTANNTMLEYSGQECPGSNPAAGLMRGALTNTTTFTVTWNTTTSSQRNYKCVVGEFVAAILAQNVQRGTIALSAQTSNTATITSSPVAETVANWLGNSSTQTTVNFAVAGCSLVQTNATTLTMAANSSASGTGSYEAIDFAPGSGSKTLAPTAGAFSISGKNAALAHGYNISPASGSLSIAGHNAGLQAQRTLAPAPGSLAITGRNAGLNAQRTVAAASGAYSLSGRNAALTRGYNLAPASGLFSIGGKNAAPQAQRALAAARGQFSLTGNVANLAASASKPAAAGKIKKRIRQKARIDALAERYNELLARDTANEAVAPIIRAFTRETAASDVFSLPPAASVDFEALAAHEKSRKEFLAAVRRVARMRAEEEEFAVLLLASIA